MESYRIIEEYIFTFNKLEHPVRAKISQSIIIDNFSIESEKEYSLDFSHSYKPTKSAGFYHKSNVNNNIEKLYEDMILYIKGFEDCFDTEINRYY
jgi:hypothetical protein